MPAHKHCDLIKAWADGAKIQVECYDGAWETIPSPSWNIENKYRIKPESRKIYYRFYLTQSNKVGCWTSDYVSSEEAMASYSSFKKWLTDKLVREFDV